MYRSIPVAGAIVERSADGDPLVVEAEPASEVTRCLKNVARFAFRVVQELRWSGHEGPVRVAVAGDGPSAAIVAPNVATLLAPLLTVCVVEDAGMPSPSMAFGVDPVTVSAIDPPSPRDRIWLVPAGAPADRVEWERYDLVIGRQEELAANRVPDLCLIVVSAADPRVSGSWLEAPDVGLILDGSPDADHPEYIDVLVS
jgi:hypothetical protein